MKKIIPLVIVSLIVGAALGYAARPVPESPVGGVVIDQDHMVNGFYAGDSDQLSVNSSGVLSTSGGITSTGALTGATFASGSVGSSSSSPAALGSAVAGHFVIDASATTASASTTAVTANSTIILQQESSTPIAGTTCNTTIASSTVVTSKVAGNGFTVTNSYAPSTNPQCMAYWIIN